MTETMINFNGYKNLINTDNISFCTHDNEYSVKIKSIAYSYHLNNNDIELAYDHCKSTFFEMVDIITDIYGYKGFITTGRSNGYISPLVEGLNCFKTIPVIYDEYISFADFVIQQKIESYAETILRVKKDIENIYTHSKDLNQINQLIEQIYEGVIYV